MTLSIGGSLSSREKLLAAVYLEEEQRDLILVCRDGYVVRGHQVIFSLHSRFLYDLFSQRACCGCRSLSCGGLTELTLHLESFEKKIVLTLLEYLYTGECTVKDRQAFRKLLQLKSSLCLDIEIGPLPEKQPDSPSEPGLPFSLSDRKADSLVVAREGQKRMTVEIMTAIEEINKGVKSVLCSECDQILFKDTFLLHYRNHMQSYSKILQELEEMRSTKSTSEDQDKVMQNTESELELQASSNSDNLSDHEKDVSYVSSSEQSESDVLDSSNEEEESLGVTNFDIEDYEKLLRAHIHSSILRRKRKKVKGMKGLILVSQKEVEEEIRKVPRNETEEYAKLKVKNIVKHLCEKKRRTQPTFAFIPSMISNEEVREVIERENKCRKIKLVLDIDRARSRNCKTESVQPGDTETVQTVGTVETETV